MIESVDKLREACKGHMYTGCDDIPHLICDAFGIGHRPYNWGSVLIPVCDAIEAEIEHDYMRLPVDADGVPVRIGDVMEFAYDPPQDQPIFEVSGFGAKGALFYVPRGEIRARKTTTASVVRHAKPRTLEDVLMDAGVSRAAINDVADEIRELMGGDA